MVEFLHSVELYLKIWPVQLIFRSLKQSEEKSTNTYKQHRQCVKNNFKKQPKQKV